MIFDATEVTPQRSEGFPSCDIRFLHFTPGVLPDGQSTLDTAAVAAASWFQWGAIAPRSPHLAYLAVGWVIPDWLVFQCFQIHMSKIQSVEHKLNEFQVRNDS